MRIGIIDDDGNFLKRVIQVLKEQVPGSEVFTWQAAEKLRQQLNVVRDLDVLIVDLNLPKPEGIKLIYDMIGQMPDLNCMILTNQADEASILDGLSAGAVGYIAKSEIGELGKAVKDVTDGKGSISPLIALQISRVMKQNMNPKVTEYDGLTPREQEILEVLSTGATAMAVAAKLGIAFDTVRAHIKNIYKKFGVHSRLQLVKKLNL
ncbi:MAG: response regulator transcription factor [Turneriella sp.]|nr:response regulator transcription factor [Turneriella sp.]